jgi:hypothetical protein
MAYGIQLASFHIPGVDNHLADTLSRHSDYHEDPEDTQLSATIASYRSPSAEFVAMVTAHYDQLRSRSLLSRTIVMAAVFRHSHYAHEEILLLVNLLAHTSSYPPSAYASRKLCDVLFAPPPETKEGV